MEIQKNSKKFKPTDAKREFYSCLIEMRDLYKNQGYLKQKSLYEKMKEKHRWQMSYNTFTLYFNKEIKNKNFHPTSQGENSNSKENEIVDNDFQIIPKETNDEKDKTSTIDMTDDAYKATKERLDRSMSYHEQGIQNHLKYRQELKEKEENENNGNS